MHSEPAGHPLPNETAVATGKVTAWIVATLVALPILLLFAWFIWSVGMTAEYERKIYSVQSQEHLDAMATWQTELTTADSASGRIPVAQAKKMYVQEFKAAKAAAAAAKTAAAAAPDEREGDAAMGKNGDPVQP